MSLEHSQVDFVMRKMTKSNIDLLYLSINLKTTNISCHLERQGDEALKPLWQQHSVKAVVRLLRRMVGQR